MSDFRQQVRQNGHTLGLIWVFPSNARRVCKTVTPHAKVRTCRETDPFEPDDAKAGAEGLSG
jgi:hypothetical protein